MSGPSVKVSADWLDSDRVEDLGAEVAMLMLSALGYSARQLSEGVVPRRALRKLWPVADIDAAVARLVAAGEVDDQGEQLMFLRWRDFILTTDEVERIKEQNRVRDERRRRHNKQDHTMCSARYCPHVRASRGSHVSEDVAHADPIRPDPTPREEQGEKRVAPAVRRPGRPGESTIAKAADPEPCSHGEPFGMKVIGSGANASRKCVKCELDFPMPQVASSVAEERAS